MEGTPSPRRRDLHASAGILAPHILLPGDHKDLLPAQSSVARLLRTGALSWQTRRLFFSSLPPSGASLWRQPSVLADGYIHLQLHSETHVKVHGVPVLRTHYTLRSTVPIYHSLHCTSRS